ncbi:hypothetical protein VTI74DRAFT_3791 [Chaetomium olivicolor]
MTSSPSSKSPSSSVSSPPSKRKATPKNLTPSKTKPRSLTNPTNPPPDRPPRQASLPKSTPIPILCSPRPAPFPGPSPTSPRRALKTSTKSTNPRAAPFPAWAKDQEAISVA